MVGDTTTTITTIIGAIGRGAADRTAEHEAATQGTTPPHGLCAGSLTKQDGFRAVGVVGTKTASLELGKEIIP